MSPEEVMKQIALGEESGKLCLVGSTLSGTELSCLKNALLNKTIITALQVGGKTKLAEMQLMELVEEIQDHLTELQFVSVGLGPCGAQAISTSVQASYVEQLNLSGNRILSQGAIYLAAAIRDSGLVSMILKKNKIEGDGAIAIADALEKGATTLQKLDLSENWLGEYGNKALFNVLPESSLTSLLLSKTGVNYDAIKTLCEILGGGNTQLAHLSLACNELDDDSGVALAKALPKTKLETLDLQENNMTGATFEAFTEAIAFCKTLAQLNLGHNYKLFVKGVSQTDEDAIRKYEVCQIAALMNAVRCHRAIKEIRMTGCVRTPKHEELDKVLAALHTKRANAMTVLCSVRIERISTKTVLRMLPNDLIRLAVDML
jgi:Ran GTPase-activating protein (RanGAP) involved in mRNA processing and transport